MIYLLQRKYISYKNKVQSLSSSYRNSYKIMMIHYMLLSIRYDFISNTRLKFAYTNFSLVLLIKSLLISIVLTKYYKIRQN